MREREREREQTANSQLKMQQNSYYDKERSTSSRNSTLLKHATDFIDVIKH